MAMSDVRCHGVHVKYLATGRSLSVEAIVNTMRILSSIKARIKRNNRRCEKAKQNRSEKEGSHDKAPKCVRG